MNFSDRTNWNLAENDLTAAVRARRAAGRDLIDLTVSNPTQCGFDYHAEALLAPLSDRAALHYEPVSLGLVSAREAVGRYYDDMGIAVAIDRICLTTSTSEAYSFLFRLLCNAGDEVLVARPSYPLFDYIAQLDDVQLREYPLFYDPHGDDPHRHGPHGNDPHGNDPHGNDPHANFHGAAAHGWSIDLHALEAAIGPRTRAIVVVHPNNPTGNFASAAERAALEALCAARGLALLVDEVFLDYAVNADQALQNQALPRSFADEPACLTFVLSGLSKVCALPQMKVSWIAVCGPEALAAAAVARLEIIADTFLSVNTPMQLALPQWLGQRHGIQHAIRERLRLNLRLLDERLNPFQRSSLGSAAPGPPQGLHQHSLAERLAIEGGWTVVLRVPRFVAGSDFAEAALDCGVLVQPGEFYGLPAGRAVLSLLTQPQRWSAGLRRLPIDSGEAP